MFSSRNKQPQPNQFEAVASIYDDLMAGISYEMWVRYLKDLWAHRRLKPKSVLDVACGTGNVSFRLAREGYQVVGVDYSEPMVAAAQAKLENRTYPSLRMDPSLTNPCFYCQDAAELDLPFEFDTAVSLFDSLNYITDPERFQSACRAVFRHLRPGGVFMFDVNTVYALSHGFFDQDNLYSDSYPRYVWRSRWDDISRLCTVEMDFEISGASGRETFHETHVQRGYTRTELQEYLENAGFQDIEFLQAYTMRRPGKRADRIYVLASRRESSDTSL